MHGAENWKRRKRKGGKGKEEKEEEEEEEKEEDEEEDEEDEEEDKEDEEDEEEEEDEAKRREEGRGGGGSLSKISSEETLSKLRLKLNQNKAKSTKHAGRPADYDTRIYPDRCRLASEASSKFSESDLNSRCSSSNSRGNSSQLLAQSLQMNGFGGSTTFSCALPVADQFFPLRFLTARRIARLWTNWKPGMSVGGPTGGSVWSTRSTGHRGQLDTVNSFIPEAFQSSVSWPLEIQWKKTALGFQVWCLTIINKRTHFFADGKKRDNNLHQHFPRTRWAQVLGQINDARGPMWELLRFWGDETIQGHCFFFFFWEVCFFVGAGTFLRTTRPTRFAWRGASTYCTDAIAWCSMMQWFISTETHQMIQVTFLNIVVFVHMEVVSCCASCFDTVGVGDIPGFNHIQSSVSNSQLQSLWKKTTRINHQPWSWQISRLPWPVSAVQESEPNCRADLQTTVQRQVQFLTFCLNGQPLELAKC